MASRPAQTLEIQCSEDHNDDTDLEELDKLEADVKQMSQKILDYRATLPDELKNTLTLIIASQRHIVATHLDYGSEPGPYSDHNPNAEQLAKSGKDASVGEDQETFEKTILLKQKISNNASAMPAVLKRMKECMSRIDSLDSCSGIIHPAFRKKRIS